MKSPWVLPELFRTSRERPLRLPASVSAEEEDADATDPVPVATCLPCRSGMRPKGPPPSRCEPSCCSPVTTPARSPATRNSLCARGFFEERCQVVASHDGSLSVTCDAFEAWGGWLSVRQVVPQPIDGHVHISGDGCLTAGGPCDRFAVAVSFPDVESFKGKGRLDTFGSVVVFGSRADQALTGPVLAGQDALGRPRRCGPASCGLARSGS